jgi:hypothetical protein
MPDDIHTDHATSQTERKPAAPSATGGTTEPVYRQVGPESEVRGGPEAPSEPNNAARQRRGSGGKAKKNQGSDAIVG